MGAAAVSQDPPRRLVTCSCGWGRECVSAWQAQAAAKLHQRLSELDVEHAVRIEAPELRSAQQELQLS